MPLLSREATAKDGHIGLLMASFQSSNDAVGFQQGGEERYLLASLSHLEQEVKHLSHLYKTQSDPISFPLLPQQFRLPVYDIALMILQCSQVFLQTPKLATLFHPLCLSICESYLIAMSFSFFSHLVYISSYHKS